MSDIATQMARARRESIRWFLLVTANVARPAGAYTETLLPVIQANYPDATHTEVKRELDYLESRELVTIKRDGMDRWYVDLTRPGIDVVEYTVDCEPGIARPKFSAS